MFRFFFSFFPHNCYNSVSRFSVFPNPVAGVLVVPFAVNGDEWVVNTAVAAAYACACSFSICIAVAVVLVLLLM